MLDRRLLLVTGKGGVGRSTIAASLAVLGVSAGRTVLTCDTDGRGDMADLFETVVPGFTPSAVELGLWSMTMDTEASLREYLRLQLRVPVVGHLGPLARMLDFVATAAPGVREILSIGKIAWEVRERHYDLVVVDAAASGHILGQLTAPAAINRLVAVGQVRQQTGWVSALLADPATTSLVVVTTSEEMPVNETIELVGRVWAETDVAVAGVVVNRVLPELFSRSEEELFERLAVPPAVALLDQRAGGAVAPVFDAARLAVRLRRHRAAHLDRLRAALGDSVPIAYVPELFTRGRGRRTLNQVAEALRAELPQ